MAPENRAASPRLGRAPSFWQRLGLGTGGLPDLGMQFGILLLASPIFNVGLGVSPIVIGVAMALPRIMEMFLDPCVGNLSDRTRGRFGRRQPYILAGGIAGGIVFAVIWWVPASWPAEAKSAWLIVFSLLQFVAFSFFIVPYSALLAEVSSDPIERTRIMAMRTVFTTVCSAAIGWLYWLAQRSVFSDPVHGMRVVGIGFALIIVAGVVLPVLVCPASQDTRPEEPPGRKESEFQTMKELLQISEFRGVLYAILSVIGGFTLIATLGFYAQAYFAFGGDTKATAALNGFSGLAGSIAGVAVCPLIAFLAARIGTWTTLTAFLGISLLGEASVWWTLHPAHPYFYIASWVLIQWGLIAFWTFVPSITGEICHAYERKTGKSLYGSFFGIYNFCQKLAGSLALLLAGVILDLTGFSAALGGKQLPATLFLMRLLNMALPALGTGLALFFLLTRVKRAVPLADRRLRQITSR